MSDSNGPGGSREEGASRRTYVFAEFEFDERRWELRARGEALAVPPKVMETLALLLRNRDRLVSNEELREALWPDVTVTDASLVKAIRIARQILGDDGDAQRFIRTTRSRGYRFVGAVEEREEAPQRPSRPPSVAPPRDPDRPLPDGDEPFVGRETELLELDRCLERAFAGRGAVVLLAGDAGIGKTRALQAFAVRAERRGARVLWGRCVEEGGAPELWPWLQILRALAAEGSSGDILSTLEEGARAPSEESDASGPLFRTEGMRFRFFDSVLGLLRRVAAKEPLVLVLEDLHSADAASILLARYLSRELDGAPVLVLGSYRPGDVQGGPAGTAPFGKLVRGAAGIKLGGLSMEETAGLIRAAFPGALTDPSFAERVFSATEGNPLFVSEILRRASASGVPPAALQEIGIPERVVEVIRGRLEALSSETRELLSVAAVLGRTFDLGILERVAGRGRQDLAGLLEPALERSIVARDASAPETCRFTHALVRDVCYDALGTSRRAALHDEAGNVLESLTRPGGPVPAAQLAHHFIRAALVAGRSKAIRYSLAAGEQAMRAYAFEEASDHFEAALDGLRFETDQDIARVDALVSLGHARRLAGQYPAASDAFTESVELARRLEDPVRTARAALGYARVHPDSRREDPKVVALLEEAVRLLEGASIDRPEVAGLLTLSLSRLATSTSLFGRPADAERWSRRALDLAGSLGDPATRARALEARHWLLWRPGKAEERLGLAEETLELARIARDVDLQGDARVCELTDLLELGRIDAFERVLSQYERSARGQRDANGLYNVGLFETTRALLEGRWDDAERRAREGLELGSRLFERNARTNHNTVIWWMRLEQGRAREIEGLFRAHAESEPSNLPLRSGLLRTHVEAGSLDAARQLLSDLSGGDFLALPDDWTFLAAASHAAVACEALKDEAAGSALLARLVPHVGSHALLGPGIVHLGPVSLHAGLCAHAAARLDEAVLHLERAVDECAATRAHAATARARYHLAKALAERGSQADAARSREVAAQALIRARELGMAGVERRVLELGGVVE